MEREIKIVAIQLGYRQAGDSAYYDALEKSKCRKTFLYDTVIKESEDLITYFNKKYPGEITGAAWYDDEWYVRLMYSNDTVIKVFFAPCQ